MKLLFIIPLIALTFCAKKRTCNCQVTTTINNSAVSSENVTTEYEHASKKYAKDQCSNKTIRSSNSTTVYSSCRITTL